MNLLPHLLLPLHLHHTRQLSARSVLTVSLHVQLKAFPWPHLLDLASLSLHSFVAAQTPPRIADPVWVPLPLPLHASALHQTLCSPGETPVQTPTLRRPAIPGSVLVCRQPPSASLLCADLRHRAPSLAHHRRRRPHQQQGRSSKCGEPGVPLPPLLPHTPLEEIRQPSLHPQPVVASWSGPSL